VDKTFQATGMHCRSCTMLVDMMVRDVADVQDVCSDHVTGQIVVTVPCERDGQTEEIVAAIERAGFEVEPN